MEVEVRDRDVSESPLRSGDGPDPDGAVAAKDENRAVTLAEGVPDTSRGPTHHVDYGLEILGAGPRSVGAPGNDRRIPEIAHLKADAGERFDQPSRSQRGGSPFLSNPAGSGARG
jgi:hypothetical protein